MSLPPKTTELLFREGTWALPGFEDADCEGAAFHSPTPMFVQPVRLVRRSWWPEDPEQSTWWSMAPSADLCGTCRDNLDILTQMYYHAQGMLPWEVRREFGNRIRALAQKGWDWYVTHRPAEQAPSNH